MNQPAHDHADLAHAIAVIGRSLPMGLEIKFYRDPIYHTTIVETSDQDGNVRRDWYSQVIN